MRAGLPREPAELLALAAAVAILLLAPHVARIRTRTLLAVGAVTAAALSALYVVLYLRGGPRIIDATTYFLEARALAEGHLGFEIGEPAAATMGRFLVRAGGDGPRAAGIFPPGYPAVLALGFLAHAPMAVGPALGALIVVATWKLAERVAPTERAAPPLAAGLAVVCAALRYHTADTMSHGLAALCFTAALAALLAALDAPTERVSRAALLAGLCAGWLAATRPASALALGAAMLLAALTCGRGVTKLPKILPAVVLGALPGLGLLVVHQQAATGAWLTSSQQTYYALSDGPPGCFRYGFGAGVGCVGEHGDFVKAHLGEGYGLFAALGTTLRRLRLHLVDVGNAEPLFALVLAGVWMHRREPRVRLLAITIVVQVLVYAPFYFDGNYPGGGGRMFADILPLELVLGGLAAASFARRARGAEARARLAAVPLALALVGFSVRGGYEHAALRDREGGRPMFEPGELRSHGVERGLVFLGTDHGFDLAFDPDGDPAKTVRAARRRGDAIDQLVWEARGRPPAFVYDYDVASGAVAVTPWKPQVDLNDTLRIEGESLWPPTAQRDAWASVEFASTTCAVSGRILAVHPAGAAPSITIELPSAVAGHALSPVLAVVGHPRGALTLVADGRPLHRWSVDFEAPKLACEALPAASTPPDARKIHLIVDLEPAEFNNLLGIDAIDIATSKSIDPLRSKVGDSQGIH